MNEREHICTCCSCLIDPEEVFTFDNDELCGDCFEAETVTCSCCGTRLWNDDNAGDGSTPLCQRCYDRSYTTCEECGRVIPYDDCYSIDGEDENYCYSCYERLTHNRSIRPYGYKPDPIFYGHASRYFGIELEIDDGGEDNSNAATLLKIANEGSVRLYAKHDGSIHEGFEMVSHPMTLDFHKNEMPWAEIMKKAVSLGYHSHQTTTCGLHIHVNRDSFGETEVERDACIARILYFFEKFWDELLKFSRRNRRQIERWAARYGMKENPKDVLKHAKSSYGGSRYSCVNLTNYSTIEFRIFRGTLKYNTLIATLQLVNRICDAAVLLDDVDFQNMSWTSFVSGCQDLPELVLYLKERRLFVNDPVESEEDI